MLYGCGWMFFFVLLNSDVLVGVVAFDIVCVCVVGVVMREEWACLLLAGV
jgi:hypothetical protein